MTDRDNDKTRTHVVLAAGVEFSHYRIIEQIGAGGMGEVYLALDTKLNRRVALKFLPTHLCQDEGYRRRFTREAQAAAALDHPNIAGIHEVGEHQGRPFYSMQLVEGQSLRELIAGKDLPIERILEIAIQVCEGLQGAHDKGVIHRDIKPSNILIDGYGRVRIVDFGLASIRGSEQLTKTGSTLGTIGYMSPEQVQGDEVDRRSDLFSLGVVLYELVTKRNPFARDNESATLKAVITDSPEPLARFKSGLPDGLQIIIDKALEKDVKTRYQSAQGMLSDLIRVKRFLDSTSSVSTIRTPVTDKRTLVRTSFGIVIILALLVTAYWLLRDDSNPISQTSQQSQITFLGDVVRCEISPDASLVAYSRQSDGVQTLEVKDLRGGKAVGIFSHKRLFDFRWSPDGAEILIAAHGETMGIYVVPRLGGENRFYPFKAWSGTNVSWLPDGSGFLVKSPEYPKRIFRFDKLTGAQSHFDVDGPFEGFRYSECHPNGHRVLIRSWARDEAIWTARMDGSDLKLVYDGTSSGARWLPDGSSVVFLQENGHLWDMMEIEIDGKSGETRSQPRQRLAGLKADGRFSVSDDGRSVSFVESMSYSNLWRVNLAADTSLQITDTDQITAGTQRYGTPDISPDGEWVAFTKRSGALEQIHVMKPDGTDQRQVTFANLSTRSPSWSPDGSQIAFVATREGTRFAGIVNADGSEMRLFDSIRCGLGLTWSQNREIVYEGRANESLGLLDSPSGDSRPLTDGTSGWAFSPAYSRDGSRIAFYYNHRSGDDSTGVWIIDSTSSLRFRTQWTRDETALYPLIWSRSDKEIYCWNGLQLWSVDATTGQVTPALEVPFGSVWGVSIAPQLDFMICNVAEWKGDLWLAEGFEL